MQVYFKWITSQEKLHHQVLQLKLLHGYFNILFMHPPPHTYICFNVGRLLAYSLLQLVHKYIISHAAKYPKSILVYGLLQKNNNKKLECILE